MRDLLLGREPKDFDIATDAAPEEVKALFRNCRLIGRRFRLAHVRFRGEIVEVATFRASSDDDSGDRELDNGRLVRDNLFGSIEEDAWRRDFTVNALYYDIDNFSVLDYVGGMEDLRSGTLRLIGDPVARYREDPVRMLRAVRFAAKLGFRLHPETEGPIAELAPLLRDIAPARLFDEVLKLFLGGCAVQGFELLRHYGLFGELFPATERSLSREEEGFPLTFVAHALANTDSRVAEGKPVTPAFLFASLYWEPVRERAAELVAGGASETQALQLAADETIARQLERIALPRRFGIPMREIWLMQPRLGQRGGRRVWRLLDNERFRAAYDFLVLRARAGEGDAELADWWTRFPEIDRPGQQAMLEALSPSPGRRRRRRRRRPRSDAPA